jgi:hypothetical protein
MTPLADGTRTGSRTWASQRRSSLVLAALSQDRYSWVHLQEVFICDICKPIRNVEQMRDEFMFRSATSLHSKLASCYDTYKDTYLFNKDLQIIKRKEITDQDLRQLSERAEHLRTGENSSVTYAWLTKNGVRVPNQQELFSKIGVYNGPHTLLDAAIRPRDESLRLHHTDKPDCTKGILVHYAPYNVTSNSLLFETVPSKPHIHTSMSLDFVWHYDASTDIPSRRISLRHMIDNGMVKIADDTDPRGLVLTNLSLNDASYSHPSVIYWPKMPKQRIPRMLYKEINWNRSGRYEERIPQLKEQTLTLSENLLIVKDGVIQETISKNECNSDDVKCDIFIRTDPSWTDFQYHTENNVVLHEDFGLKSFATRFVILLPSGFDTEKHLRKYDDKLAASRHVILQNHENLTFKKLTMTTAAPWIDPIYFSGETVVLQVVNSAP